MVESKGERPWGWLLILALGAAFLYLAKSVMVPFLIAFFLAYAFDPLIGFMGRVKVRRSLAVWVVFIGIFLAVTLFFLFVIPIVQDEIVRSFEKFPAYWEQIRVHLFPYFEQRFGFHFPKTLDETLTTLLPRLRDEAPSIFKPVGAFILSFFSGAFGILIAVANLIVIPFAFYYFLNDFDRIKRGWGRLIPPRYRSEVEKRLQEIDRSLSGFIRGQLLIVLILAILYGIGLTWVGVDLAFVLGGIAGLMEIVPYAGFIVGLSLALLMAFLQFQDWIHPLYVFLLMGGIQSVQGLVIGPNILGREVGLHPLVIIAAIYIGGDLFGFVGILLAVPGAAVTVVLLKALIEYYRASALFQGRVE